MEKTLAARPLQYWGMKLDMSELEKPLPEINSLSQPFWEAAADNKLVIQRCSNCGVFVWCPRPSCTECGGDQLEWKTMSGRGMVFSFTIVREVTEGRGRGFVKDIPYIIAWIDLEEGPRFCSNVVDCPIDKVTIGMPVEAVFEKAGGDISLPKFRPR